MTYAELKTEVSNIMLKYLRPQGLIHDYIPVQEIAYAENKIDKVIDALEANTYTTGDVAKVLLEAQDYLYAPDKEFYDIQTVNTKDLTNNQVILMTHALRALFNTFATENSLTL